MSWQTKLLGLICSVTLFTAHAEEKPALDLQEQVIKLPVTVTSSYQGRKTRDMLVTVYRPPGAGPFPLVVISHGRAVSVAERAKPERVRFENVARYFARKGFVVLVPTRLGYGATGQDFDPEDSGGRCDKRDYHPAIAASSAQVLAALDYGRTLPGVDKHRIVLIGQSVGGMTTVAAAADNPAGVIAAINFAGGAGGNPDEHPGVPCSPWAEETFYADMGKQARIPMLWMYTENDKFFGPAYSQQWARRFAEGGAPVEYRLLPAFGDNGHHLFARGGDIWMPIVEAYLRRYGFTQSGLINRPAATQFAALNAVDKVPHLSAGGQQGYQDFLHAAAPRAFAVDNNGDWGSAWGDDALARALGNCQRNKGAPPCRLYAVDNDVVW